MKTFVASYHGYFLLTSAALNLFIILLIIFSGVKRMSTYSFLHCLVGIVGYQTTYGILSLTTDPSLMEKLVRVGQFFINQISPGFYIFSVYFLSLSKQKRFANFSPFLGLVLMWFLYKDPVPSVVHYWWGNFNRYPMPESGPILTVYFVFFFGLMLLSFGNFLVAYRMEKSKPKKIEIRNIFVAFSIAYLAGFDHLPILGIDTYPIGYIPITLFTFIVFYTIARYRFLDIRLGLKRLSLISAIYVFLLILMAPVAIPVAKFVATSSMANSHVPYLMFGGIMGMALSVGPLIYAVLVRNSFWLKGHLTQGLTHELKSPLGNIQGAVEILLEQIKNPNSSKKDTLDYVHMIQKNSLRLESFVKDLLSLAKIQDDAVTLEKTEFDVSKEIILLVEANRPLLETKTLTVSLDIPNSCVVLADKPKLSQILSNLMSNAIRYSHQGIIHIVLKKNIRDIEFSIRDNGIGIHPKNLMRVFDRFFQASTNAKGSGLGLTIAKAWVEAHGGKIWAESEGEGKGSVFRFVIPINS